MSEADEGATGGGPPTESRWWYWLVAAPVLTLVELVLGAALLATVSVSGGGFDPAHLVVVAPYTLVALAVRLLFPVAIFFDARAVRTANLDWRPSSERYALAGVVAVPIPLADCLVAGYYLRLRARHVGVP
ncbi:hypothetical protein [Halospeciosus flavus]|uniref:Uncharacterized protein n=1 Tax=Halospeciosus flavus TaxID=3032283 RepID=A0ABD5Z782_9EURY|nr:hypothetical protein [Halospeciosus flavus]